MSTHDTERQLDDLDSPSLAELGDDVALGCESALPFLTAGAEPMLPGETRPWAPALSL